MPPTLVADTSRFVKEGYSQFQVEIRYEGIDQDLLQKILYQNYETALHIEVEDSLTLKLMKGRPRKLKAKANIYISLIEFENNGIPEPLTIPALPTKCIGAEHEIKITYMIESTNQNSETIIGKRATIQLDCYGQIKNYDQDYFKLDHTDIESPTFRYIFIFSLQKFVQDCVANSNQ